MPDEPTLGEISRRLDEYARTTGVGLDRLSAKLDALPDIYVTRREYERDDADHEQAHKDIRADIASTRELIAAVERRTLESRRWAIMAAIAAAGTLIALFSLVAGVFQ